MNRFSEEFIVNSISGEILKKTNQEEIKGVSIDSRTIKKNEVFFAIIGERFDGHNFINDAIEKGASIVVVDRDIKIKSNVTVIKVDDTTKALQDLARAYRLTLKKLKVIAITGSVGKTSTKDIIASLLKEKYKTKKTHGNLNNYYGLPLTLLDFNGDEEIAVLELGMSKLGEIDLLAQIAKPDIAVITNVGETHLETLVSVENVAKGKSELLSSMPEDRVAILNYDNKHVREMKKKFKGNRLIYYGLSKEADLYADNIKSFADSTGFILHYQGEDKKIKIDRPGQHNIYNSLAAIAVARVLGLNWSDIREGIVEVDYSSFRWDVSNKNGISIINDSYNANPLSMKAAINTATGMVASRLVLVLGPMLELGEREESAHLEIGNFIADKGVDLLITVGGIASLIAKGARKKGMKRNKIVECENKEEAVSFLEEYLLKGDILLIKGSRGVKLEEIVEELIQKM